MTRGELVSLADFNQLVQRLLVLSVRQVKRQLLDLQLPLEQIDWVLEIWVRDAVHWHTIPIDTHR